MHNDFTAQVVTTYCLCDDFLRAWGHVDDPQAKMTTAEVMTVALVAAARFGGNHRLASLVLGQHGYMSRMLSPGRLNRRLHAVPEATWQGLFGLLAGVHRRMSAHRPDDCYAVDSLPVELMLTPGSAADVAAFKCLGVDLAPGAFLFADAGHLDYEDEALLAEAAGLSLVAQRRRNSKRQWPAWLAYIGKCERKRIETVFSRIAAAFGRTIHAVTARGFELKVFLTVLAYAIAA